MSLFVLELPDCTKAKENKGALGSAGDAEDSVVWYSRVTSRLGSVLYCSKIDFSIVYRL